MAAAAEPSGHLIASDVVPGRRADDPLYVPLIDRVRGILGRAGLLYAGDKKMAALATRAYLAFHNDYYVVPLPMTGQTAEAFDSWVDRIVTGEQTVTLIESRVRRGLAEEQATLTGLYEGQPSRSTDRSTGKRLLKAFARAKITLLRVELDSNQV